MKKFHVYRSSAGSGKTFTLVREYLKLALKGDTRAYMHILAITFTNKAANEMRERILKYLTEISDPHKHAKSNTVSRMLPELARDLGVEDKVLTERAVKVLSSILHNYQDFAVSTIDSFMHRIVRAFAFDLHLPLNFEVETEEDTMVAQAVDLLLSRVGVDDGPTRALTGFIESRIGDEKNWDIERDLKSFSRKLLRDDIVKFLPDLQRMDSEDILAVSKKINSKCRKFEKELHRMAGELLTYWQSRGLSASDFSYKESGLFGYVKKLHNRNFGDLDANTRFKDAIDDDKWYPKGLEQERKELIESLKEEMYAMMVVLDNHIQENKEEYRVYTILKRNIFQLAVLNEIVQVVEQIRENDGVIHISEFDKRISDVVNSEPVPFIYERLGEKYQHYLIDEFQDTSVLEWQNLLPLVENALASDLFSMLVGDGKQAIYRFKGGEVEQLDMLPEIFEKPENPEMNDREMSLVRNFDENKLESNFRSRDDIIRFNNEFYSFVSTLLPDRLQKIYEGCVQKIGDPKPGGEVRIMFVDEEGRKEEKEPVYFEHILNGIRDLNEKLGHAYGDIAVLCRSNREASKIARELLKENIDVVSAESLLLTSSPEVNFLIHCLDYLANSENKTAMAGILTYLEKQFRDDKLNKLLRDNLQGANQHNLEAFLDGRNIRFKQSELLQMGLYEKVESLIRTFSLDDAPDPYLFFFLDVVHNYLMNKRFVPEDFTEYWRENRHKLSIVVPEGMDAVKVMTIHKAKGLEFPVVIYPFANGKAEIRNEHKWVHIRDEDLPELTTALLPVTSSLQETPFRKVYEREHEMQQLDLMNILYVATTRPTEKLYIICDKPGKAAESVNNIPSMIRAWLEHSGHWEDEKLEYRIGTPDQKAFSEAKVDDTVRPSEFISGDWRKGIMLSGHAAEYWDLDDNSRNLEWGKLVHKILSGVDTMQDLEPALQNEVNSGNIASAKAKELLQLLRSIVTDNRLEGFFDGNYILKNEAGIMRSDGEEYRPDRLLLKDGKAVVLDYKTGKADIKYDRQMKKYGTLLQEMGYSEVEMYLLYIDEPYILEKIEF